ncbi:helix-turn-helix domain-containing protein [Streptomyces sp. NPDC089799]|uniref:helix-turn-helix domain-containing protein n=1 Tax=Streptomyces sp. NPDC089799 TaxID=3155066 RepID=UPI00344324F9
MPPVSSADGPQNPAAAPGAHGDAGTGAGADAGTTPAGAVGDRAASPGPRPAGRATGGGPGTPVGSDGSAPPPGAGATGAAGAPHGTAGGAGGAGPGGRTAPASAAPSGAGAAGPAGTSGAAGPAGGRGGSRAGAGVGGAAPPIALAALLADRSLGLRLLAGPAEAELLGVHASEMADPSPYLLGSELLLTAGAGLAPAGGAGTGGARTGGAETGGGPLGAGTSGAGTDGADADAYVARLVHAGVAALGFGVAPVHAEVPHGLLAACARHGLPLLEVPQPTPFTAVARAVWRLMAEARTRELRRVAEAQQSLAAAASRPDPVPAVLRRLAAALGGWAVLLSPDGTVTASAGTPPPEPAVHALADLGRRVASGGPATAAETLPPAATSGTLPPGTAADAPPEGLRHLAAYALGPQAAGTGRAVLGTASATRTPGDHTVAGAAAVLLTLLTTARQAPGSVDAGARSSAALLRLLLGGQPVEAAALLGPGPWTVVHARPLPGTDARAPGAAAALAAELGAALVDAGGPAVRLLTDREPEPRPGWRLGASSPAGAAGLAAADAEAAGALRRAEAARSPLLRHTADGLAALVPAAQAEAHARTLLAPLDPVLRGTLRAWLAHHGGWDRAATSLGVHRNTVRQRIARCAELLGRDLDDPDVRMELWFALNRASGADG